MKTAAPAVFLPLVSVALLTAAGTLDAVAAGFVKNADVGGYRVIVEGGGVEARKEIQYDADGNVIYDSRGINLQNLNKGTIDNSLLGGGLELNLDPTGETDDLPFQQTENEAKADASEKKQTTESADTPAETETKPAPQKRRFKSPWTVSPEVIARAQKILAERKAAEARSRANEKKRSETSRDDDDEDSDGSISVDPRNSLVSQPMTKDGRKMPFYLTGKNYDEGEVDPSAGLKDFMRINENYGNSLDRESYDLERNEGYSNIISMKEWHSKFSSLGAKRSQRYEGTAERFSERFDSPETLERKILDNSLMWTRSRESQITVNESLARRLAEKYTTGSKSGNYDVRLPAPGERTGLSMQDINRYQFRRSHSTESGLPVVQPAGGLKNISR
ncbi:MAG: hypothetical protein IKW49_01965 [Opitutales bacterium]|nr:hypothetical protein [Opitutales bacterium]